MLGIPRTPCQDLLGLHDRIPMQGTPSQRLPRRRQPHCTHATKPLTAWLPGRLVWLGWLAWLAGLAWLDLAPPRGEELFRIGMNDKVSSRILQELLRTIRNPQGLQEVLRILKNFYESLKSSQLCSDAIFRKTQRRQRAPGKRLQDSSHSLPWGVSFRKRVLYEVPQVLDVSEPEIMRNRLEYTWVFKKRPRPQIDSDRVLNTLTPSVIPQESYTESQLESYLESQLESYL